MPQGWPAALRSRDVETRPGSPVACVAVRRPYGLGLPRLGGVDAVQNWEQQRRRPEGAARALLKVIDREPDAVQRALAAED